MDTSESERSRQKLGGRTMKAGDCEIEIKLRADRQVLEGLASHSLLKETSFSPPQDLVSTYFDTADEALRKQGIALRLRKKGRAVPILGVKWASPATQDLFARGEIEVPCPSGTPDLELFQQNTRELLLQVVGPSPLRPIFETRVKRRIASFRHGRSDFELAIDDGVVIAGGSRMPLTEFEIELKQGNTQAMVDFAMELTKAAALQLEFETKSDRGYRLASGQLPQVQKAQDIEWPSEVALDDLLAAVVSNTLQHFVANWAALRESDTPEAVHQLRVALRRMRSALTIFRRSINLAELEDIRREAKRIASALGPARECDAFRQNALGGPFQGDATLIKGATRLLEAVDARREKSYAEARRVMDEAATSHFVLTVQSFLVRRAWRAAIAPQELGLLTSDGKSFAAAVLDRLMRRALKRGKDLRKMSDEERHELRIALKNLRYSAEFFGGLFENGKSVRRFLKQIAELQEDLGAHNDMATAKSFIDSLGLAPEPETHFASGYLLGWYRHATAIADADLIKKWKTFRKTETFWE